MSSLVEATATGFSKAYKYDPVWADTFPTSLGLGQLNRPQNIGFAATYGVLGALCLVAWAASRTRMAARLTKPHGYEHRQIAYLCFVAMCACRITQCILLTIVATRAPRESLIHSWHLILGADLLSILAWGCFCAFLFTIGYSWSSRIPCVYCMVQFSDKPHWTKGAAVIAIPIILISMMVVSTALRLVSTMHGGQVLVPVNMHLWRSATFVGRASAAAALAFAISFLVVVPYTAVRRAQFRTHARKVGIDHMAMAELVSQGDLSATTSSDEVPAVVLLLVLGLLLLWEAVYRVVLLASVIPLTISGSWSRTQLAQIINVYLPEWLSMVIVIGLNLDRFDTGHVGAGVWRVFGRKPEHEEFYDSGTGHPSYELRKNKKNWQIIPGRQATLASEVAGGKPPPRALGSKREEEAALPSNWQDHWAANSDGKSNNEFEYVFTTHGQIGGPNVEEPKEFDFDRELDRNLDREHDRDLDREVENGHPAFGQEFQNGHVFQNTYGLQHPQAVLRGEGNARALYPAVRNWV